MAGRKKKAGGNTGNVSDYRHDDAKRLNNPPAGLASQGKTRETPKLHYAYDPHLPPVLRSDPTGYWDRADALLGQAMDGPLTEEETAELRDMLRQREPWLEWTGKREAQEFVVDPVALHIHERVSTQAILSAVKREDVQKDLFADPKQDYREAVRFYEHDVDWANRMILGDSLQVMASLAHREDLAGKVQMIYMDPPYGIRFASNFQPEIGRHPNRDTDRARDLTREPEMIKAFRDTWHLGVHSYLAYLRDRLMMARELLADSGSIFVQIGDDNLHRAKAVLDEVFQPENYVVTFIVQKKGSQKGDFVQPINDYLLWYTRNKEVAKQKFRRLHTVRRDHARVGKSYRFAEQATGAEVRTSDANEEDRPFASNPLTSGGERTNQSLPYGFRGQTYNPGRGACWKTTAVPTDGGLSGMRRLDLSGRLFVGKNQLRYKNFIDDFPGVAITNFWTGLGGAPNPKYVVETNPTIIERCLLMTTDPGDLVLDPTCGSGTTAYVAEQWGRRWITMDTSRVALSLARQRLLTSTFDHYAVEGDDASDGKADPGRGFKYRTVPHITLKSIAQNTALDPIFERHQKVLDARLAELNAALQQHVTPDLRKKLARKLVDKQKAEGKRAITDADTRRWKLPESEWQEWEVPFDTDEDWPAPLQEALTAYRKAWRAKMDEVNDTIAASAPQEELVDQPDVEKGVTRVTGPFTMEAVMPAELSEEGGFGGGPEEELGTFDPEAEAANAEGYVDRILRLLLKSGIRFPDNRTQLFERLDRVEAGVALQGEGEWAGAMEGDEPRRIVVSLGPEHGAVSAPQVEEALREANRRGADDIVFAGFSFDGAAQAAIQDDLHPHVRTHLAHIAPDVQMGDLLKTAADSQLFTVFGQPRTTLEKQGEEYVVEMEGVDIYDPVANTIHPTRADRVAAWFLDTDYDGRTFCITQAFFPDRTAWKKLERALRGTIDEERFDALSGTRSLPFRAGEKKRVAVKVIDPRGNEVMRVHRLTGED
ncbi:MAG: site-specific DNA-methyltransferase [Gemmatimonadota bacterium]